MASNDRLNEALRKQRNADRKVSRLEHQAIRIRNTSENPHKTPSEIRSMTPAQLNAHIRRLDQFTSRTNQYVQGVDNAPIRRSSMQVFQTLQERLRNTAEKLESKVGGLTLPGSDTTVNTMIGNRGKRKDAQGMEQTGRVFSVDNRTAKNFKSQASLEKAIADMRRKESKNYVRSTIDKRLNSIRAALTYSGNVDFLDQINELEWDEKLLLLDYSNFGMIAQLNIDSGKYDSSGNVRSDYEAAEDEPMQDDEELRSDLQNVLNWVRQNGAKARTRGTGRNGRK